MKILRAPYYTGSVVLHWGSNRPLADSIASSLGYRAPGRYFSGKDNDIRELPRNIGAQRLSRVYFGEAVIMSFATAWVREKW
jgi:hypothetical protein